MMVGYRFRLCWSATGMNVIINGTSREHAESKLERWTKRGAVPHYRGVTRPNPPNRRWCKLPKKVF